MNAKRLLGGLPLLLLALTVTACTPTPSPTEPPAFDERVEVEVPTPAAAGPTGALISARLQSLGVPNAVSAADRRIIVNLTSGDRVVNDSLFTVAGNTSIRPVLETAESGAEQGSPVCAQTAFTDPCLSTDPDGVLLSLGPAVVFPEDIAGASAESGTTEYALNLELTEQGETALTELTSAIACDDDADPRLGILIDGDLFTVPELALPCGEELGSPVQLAGGFTEEDAKLFAAILAHPGIPAGTVITSRS
ncbi:SecDF P1 head subdomain-containing protein [Microbacterium sp.]|uniref:SecDF P1 head subdomain-containing protein n=1 Tax=Microbacterium sp. TaxID=51671 RepID=UPI003A8A2B64